MSDFSAIEARVLAWMAGEQWRIDAFNEGRDIYCESASQMFGVPVVKHGENGHLRQQGKVAELACGYGGGVGAIVSMDSKGAIPEEDIAGIVKAWRLASPKIVKMWSAVERAAVKTVEDGSPRTANHCTFRRVTIDGNKILLVRLPSGRDIAYWGVGLIEGTYGPALSYEHQNQTTRKWERVETYGGKLTENIIQSVARDCLAAKMKEVTDAGYSIVFHVHDEMIIEAPEEDVKAAEVIDRIMGSPISWASDLPLKGDTYECNFYRKG